jgi:hypothetical protein
LKLCGLRATPMPAAELAEILRRRFPKIDPDLEADLAACEIAVWRDTVTSREALRLIQALHNHEEKLRAAAKPGNATKQPKPLVDLR